MKEYQNRHLKPLVNPPVLNGEFQSEPVSAAIAVSIDGFLFNIVRRYGKWSATSDRSIDAAVFVRAFEKAKRIAKERNE